MNLLVRVNDDLTLAAGTTDLAGAEMVIRPPKVTLFRQVLDYLRGKPDPPAPPSGTFIDHEGAAAAAVALRWGSYLAVLADRAKPVWSETRSPGTSRIADSGMARVNVEASAALSDWIDLCRDEPAVYEQLVLRAVAYGRSFGSSRPRSARRSRRRRRRASLCDSPGRRVATSTPPMIARPCTRSNGRPGSGCTGTRSTWLNPPMMAVPDTSTARLGGTVICTPPMSATM